MHVLIKISRACQDNFCTRNSARREKKRKTKEALIGRETELRVWLGKSKLLKQSQMEGTCKVLGATPMGQHGEGGGGIGSTRLTTDLKKPN